VAEVVLGSHPVGAPERGGMGFTLLMFAGELASVLGVGELGLPAWTRPCAGRVGSRSLRPR
jgi:hypothetical protein